MEKLLKKNKEITPSYRTYSSTRSGVTGILEPPGIKSLKTFSGF